MVVGVKVGTIVGFVDGANDGKTVGDWKEKDFKHLIQEFWVSEKTHCIQKFIQIWSQIGFIEGFWQTSIKS